MTPRHHVSGIGDTTAAQAAIPVALVTGIVGPSAGVQVAANIAAPAPACSGLTAPDVYGNCTLKQWCAEASWWNPVAIVACVGSGVDIADAAGTIVANASGVPTLPGPTVVPGTGTPQVPSNYNPASGTCTDASGNPATCSTNTEATPIQYATPDPAAICAQAGYVWDASTATCSQPTTNWMLYGAIAVAALFLIARETKR